MYSGEGDGGQVPPVHLEMQAESHPLEVERGRRERAYSLRPLYPSNHQVPFKTSKGFGNWLYHQLDSRTFAAVHLKFMRYERTFRIKQLVRLAKRSFRDIQRLYFLQGLHIIAATKKQKNYIKHVFQMERMKIQMKRQASLGTESMSANTGSRTL